MLLVVWLWPPRERCLLETSLWERGASQRSRWDGRWGCTRVCKVLEVGDGAYAYHKRDDQDEDPKRRGCRLSQ